MHEDLFVQWAEGHLDGSPFHNVRTARGRGVVDVFSPMGQGPWTGWELKQALRRALDVAGLTDVRLTVDHDRRHGLRFFNLAIRLQSCTDTRLQALAAVVQQWKREHPGTFGLMD